MSGFANDSTAKRAETIFRLAFARLEVVSRAQTAPEEPQAGGRCLRRLHRHVPKQRDPDEAHVEGSMPRMANSRPDSSRILDRSVLFNGLGARQVDSRRTWELSKLITRNVEIARRAQSGAPTEALLPKMPEPEKEETPGATRWPGG